VNIRVEFDQTGASFVSSPVLDTGPAIFTLNGRGQGHAVAVNPNGSVNDTNNPVPAGEVVRVFGTGFGAVEPPIASGALAPADTLHRVVENVEASIGGVSAEVSFAGLAPNFVALYQIDLTVPSDAPTGDIVPLGMSVGDRGLENLVWISVE